MYKTAGYENITAT